MRIALLDEESETCGKRPCLGGDKTQLDKTTACDSRASEVLRESIPDTRTAAVLALLVLLCQTTWFHRWPPPHVCYITLRQAVWHEHVRPSPTSPEDTTILTFFVGRRAPVLARVQQARGECRIRGSFQLGGDLCRGFQHYGMAFPVRGGL